MNIIKKFLSRKFILTLLSSVFSIAFALSGIGGDVGEVCSVIAAFSAPVIYVITEGKIDREALLMLSESVLKASEAVKNSSNEDSQEGADL